MDSFLKQNPVGEESEKQLEWAETIYSWVFRGRFLLRKFWWILLLTVSIGIGYQAFNELKREPRYVSYARMIVSGRIALPDGGVYSEELSHFFGTQIQLMQSPQVQKRARDRITALKPNLKAVPVFLRPSRIPETAIFMLSAEGVEPEYTQSFLDACLQEYINFRREMRSQTSESTLLAITEELLRLEEEIEQGENAIVDFQKMNNIVFTKEQVSTAGSYLAKLKNQMADLRTQSRLLESLSLEQQMNGGSEGEQTDEFLSLSALDMSQNYKEVKNQVEQLNAEIDEFSIYMKPGHPKIIGLKQEIERTENMLEIYRRQGIEKISEQKSILRARIDNLDKVIAEWEHTALDNSRRMAEFDRLNSRLERSRTLYQRLLGSIQSIDLNLNVDQETLAILENATAARLVRGSVSKKLAQGGLAGLMIGAGLIFLIGVIDNRIVSAEDISLRFEPPVLGIIPLEKITDKGQLEHIKPKDDRHLFAEACRALRSSLLFMEDQGSKPQCIIVTSSVPSEGKSMISTNLSITLALAASRTILIDLDLRRGQLYKVFGTTRKDGLHEVINNGVELDDVIQKTEIENLDFIPCGVYPDRPGELLLSEHMEQILRELKERYDYIIFDTAPILATDDTSSFAAKTDGVLFAVRSSKTQARQVKASMERLHLRGTTVLGFILNFVDTQNPDYYYYKKYSYYYTADSLAS